MALDKLTLQMFKTIELSAGRKAVERMARGAATNNPGDPQAALELAKMAREYFLQVHHVVLVLNEGEILDEQRMERYLRERAAREAGSVPRSSTLPPLPPSLKRPPPKGVTPEEWEVKERAEWNKRKAAISERATLPEPKVKGPRAYKKVDGKVWVTLLDGTRYRVEPDMARLLAGTGQVTIDG